MESGELLALVLKYLPGLHQSGSKGGGKVSVVEAGWVWTEPHSKRCVHVYVPMCVLRGRGLGAMPNCPLTPVPQDSDVITRTHIYNTRHFIIG